MTYLIGAVVIFIVLAVLAKTVAYFTFDVTITRALQTFHAGLVRRADGCVELDRIRAASLGNHADHLVVPLRERPEMGDGRAARSACWAVRRWDSALKSLIDRPRPSADLVNVINQLKDYSFPSGHVLFFTTFFGFLLFLAYTLLKPSWWRMVLLVMLVGMVALIGPSRIYEGQHWASDVVGAYLLGSVWLALSVLIYRWGKPRFFVNQPVAKETPVSR